jgi:transposase-like protein
MATDPKVKAKALAEWAKGGISEGDLAKKYKVAKSTVYRWIKEPAPAKDDKWKPKKKGVGQPEHEWKQEIADRIVETCSQGWTRKAISADVGLCITTLLKHYRNELDQGDLQATDTVKNSLFKAATEGNSVPAMIFWLKARAGWSERVEMDHSGSLNGSVIVSLPSNGREIDAGSNS